MASQKPIIKWSDGSQLLQNGMLMESQKLVHEANVIFYARLTGLKRVNELYIYL